MRRIETVIIGGGQAGLAMSRCLSERGVDHVILERGRIAERWRSERWDSLRLLTPRWQTRLPGHRPRGPDPDGFMTMPEVVTFFERYASHVAAPIQCETTVRRVARRDDGFVVETDRGGYLAEDVVVATGAADVPYVPPLAAQLRAAHALVPTRYRKAGELPPGGVLIVGASASGVQLAAEIQRAGHPVTLAVGRHTRMPRRYRGRDIMWWLDRAGILGETVESLPDLRAARAQPSMQLSGSGHDIDLATLQAEGVRLVGRAIGADERRVFFSADIDERIARADRKLERLLDRIDRFIAKRHPESLPREALRKVQAPAPLAALDLRREGIATVIWATGFRCHHPWLEIPVVDERGAIRHRGGVTAVPGLYVIGMKLLRRRNSNFIDGVGADAEVLAQHLADRKRGPSSRAA